MSVLVDLIQRRTRRIAVPADIINKIGNVQKEETIYKYDKCCKNYAGPAKIWIYTSMYVHTYNCPEIYHEIRVSLECIITSRAKGRRKPSESLVHVHDVGPTRVEYEWKCR